MCEPYVVKYKAKIKDFTYFTFYDSEMEYENDRQDNWKRLRKLLISRSIESMFSRSSSEIYAYMAGGGCTLPGKAMVLMPGAGYEGVTKFVMDVMTSYGINACPPLLVGVGVATSVETAALLSKKALMRPLGSHNENERAASMEKLLEDGINEIGLGPQGMGGKYSVMGVHIENTARHPSAIGVAVNVGCWSHRRGHIIFDKDLNYTITTHSGVTL